MASLTSALVAVDYGCFVPDLTRFTAEPCEGARQLRILPAKNPDLFELHPRSWAGFQPLGCF